jgi:DNA modification methylase
MSGRNSIGNEIESAYVQNAEERLLKAARQLRTVGAITAEVRAD